MPSMNKKERLFASLRGEPLDRVPLSLWGHFFEKESTAEGLAESTLSFQARWDWDYIKVQPRAEYHAELWGGRFGNSPDGIEGPLCLEAVLESSVDWRRVERKGPEEGPLGEQILALRLIAKGLKGEVPFIQTVFSPLTIACYLAGKDLGRLKDLLREETAAAHAALGAIAETFRAHLPLCLEAGASGIFFAISYGPTEFMSIDEYEEFGRTYDLMVLEGARGASFNVLHLCRSNIAFSNFNDYPAHCINWSVAEPGNPTLADALRLTDKALMGGLRERETLIHGSRKEVSQEVRRALDETRGRRLLLAGGCSAKLKLIPEENLKAVREARESFRPQ